MAPQKRLVQRLETVNKKLQEVKRHLIRCGPLDAQVTPLLRQVAETLQSIKNEEELMTGSEETRRLLQEIQASMEKSGLLLHSAADLTCRLTLAKPSIAGSYAPNGEIPFLEFGGRIVVHA